MRSAVTTPVARARAQVELRCGGQAASLLPSGYQRLGRVLLVRLPPELEPHFPEIGKAYQEALGVGAVLNRRGSEQGELRVPRVELIAGSNTSTEVKEFGVRYRLDAAKLMFARGNRTERHRAGILTTVGETVVDLFAGIGYFALPAAVTGKASRVFAVEKNPVAFEFLCENARINRVVDRLVPMLGDNRSTSVPLGEADRVFLGGLPSSVEWVDRALTLLKPCGGWLHVHLLAGTRGGLSEPRSEVVRAVEQAGRRSISAGAREVKPYGPGRFHAVVDINVSG